MSADYVTTKQFEKRSTSVDLRFDAVDKRFDAVDKRFDDLENRLTQEIRNVGAVVENTNHQLRALAEVVVGNMERLTNHEARITRLESQ